MTDWQRDIADALATIEELTRERDEAKEAELWVRGQLRLIAESDAVRIEELTRERDEARTSLDALANVCGKAIVAASLADGEALLDPGCHVIVTTVIGLKKERDEARATIERMKPVVDMAVYRWRYCRRRRSFEAATMLDYVEATERATGVRP
jgi:hypothetical protein